MSAHIEKTAVVEVNGDEILRVHVERNDDGLPVEVTISEVSVWMSWDDLEALRDAITTLLEDRPPRDTPDGE